MAYGKARTSMFVNKDVADQMLDIGRGFHRLSELSHIWDIILRLCCRFILTALRTIDRGDSGSIKLLVHHIRSISDFTINTVSLT